MDWKSEYYQAYVVIIRWVIWGKIPQFTIFLQSRIGCFLNVRKKLLTFQMKSRNLINREGFSRISSQLAIYEEDLRGSGKLEMFRKLYRSRRARVFDDEFRQSELRSCNFMIEPSIKMTVTIRVPLTAAPQKRMFLLIPLWYYHTIAELPRERV